MTTWLERGSPRAERRPGFPGRARRGGLHLIAALTLTVLSTRADAQSLPLKRDLPQRGPEGCPAFVQPSRPSRDQIEEASRLTSLGQEAAINGDQRAARDLLVQAAALNPVDENAAYQLGRAHEELGDTASAALEYCRYLAIAPRASDAASIRARLQKLAGARSLVPVTSTVAAQFNTGVAQYRQNRFRDATLSFSAAAAQSPLLAEAYYNRAVSFAGLGEHARAVRDLRKYVELQPQADDRDGVLRAIHELEGRIPEPGRAFGIGLLPGGGQYYTGRSVLGTAVLGTAAAALGAAFVSKRDNEVKSYVDPFGNPYTDTVAVTKYPYFVAGVATAAAVTLAGALEAYRYARRAQAPLGSAPPGPPTARVGALRVPLPDLAPTRDGIRLAVRFRFGSP